jgi:hypothetical protein
MAEIAFVEGVAFDKTARSAPTDLCNYVGASRSVRPIFCIYIIDIWNK